MQQNLYTVSFQIEATSQLEADLKLQKMINKIAQIKHEDEMSWASIFFQLGLGAVEYYLNKKKPEKFKPRHKTSTSKIIYPSNLSNNILAYISQTIVRFI